MTVDADASNRIPAGAVTVRVSPAVKHSVAAAGGQPPAAMPAPVVSGLAAPLTTAMPVTPKTRVGSAVTRTESEMPRMVTRTVVMPPSAAMPLM